MANESRLHPTAKAAGRQPIDTFYGFDASAQLELKRWCVPCDQAAPPPTPGPVVDGYVVLSLGLPTPLRFATCAILTASGLLSRRPYLVFFFSFMIGSS